MAKKKTSKAAAAAIALPEPEPARCVECATELTWRDSAYNGGSAQCKRCHRAMQRARVMGVRVAFAPTGGARVARRRTGMVTPARVSLAQQLQLVYGAQRLHSQAQRVKAAVEAQFNPAQRARRCLCCA